VLIFKIHDCGNEVGTNHIEDKPKKQWSKTHNNKMLSDETIKLFKKKQWKNMSQPKIKITPPKEKWKKIRWLIQNKY